MTTEQSSSFGFQFQLSKVETQDNRKAKFVIEHLKEIELEKAGSVVVD